MALVGWAWMGYRQPNSLDTHSVQLRFEILSVY